MTLFYLILIIFATIIVLAQNDDGVFIKSEDDEESFDQQISHDELSKRVKRQTDTFLKSYLKNLKEGQEIVLSSGTGFNSKNRYKSGDIHIKKESKYKIKFLDLLFF